MAILDYNEIKERKYIVLDGDPYEVLDSHVFRKQQRKPVNQTKLRNLITGSVRQETFHSSDTAPEADIERSKVTFSFIKPNRQTNTNEYWFIESGNKSNRFPISSDILGDKIKWIKENQEVDALLFNEQVIGIDLPIKVTLKVTESAPAVKGNTATGATKTVKLETGAEVNTPLFINEGDSVVINTNDGNYVERAKE